MNHENELSIGHNALRLRNYKYVPSFLQKRKKETLDSGLEKTQTGMWNKISHAIAGKARSTTQVLDNLEEAFIMSDVGTDTTLKIIERLEERVARDKYVGSQELRRMLVEEVTDMLQKPDNENELDDFKVTRKGDDPYVILVVGVNGGRQDHHHRQACLAVQTSRQQGGAGSSRHIPGRRHRAA